MRDALFAFEALILGYFLAINTCYLSFSLTALFTLVAYRRRSWHADLDSLLGTPAYQPISILVPAHNEEATVAANVRSLLTLSYPEYEIVVVNDGSSDATLDVLRHAFDLVRVPPAFRVQLVTKPVRGVYRSAEHPNLVVIDKDNGGKSDALNAGINAARFPLFCCIDADSLLEPDALLRVARLFGEEPAAVAVGGIVRVLNGSEVLDGRVVRPRASRRWMVLCQTLEYIRGFLAGRTALGRLDSLLIISGAFGLFRRSAVVAAGGYSPDTVCEDMEIVVRLHRHGHESGRPGKVLFVPDPVCWTQVPEDWGSLLKQRDRWQRGLLETLWMHRNMFANPRYGKVGLIGFPFYVAFEALGPLVETLGYVLVPLLWWWGLLNDRFAVLFLVLAVLFGILITLSALVLDDLLFQRYEDPRDLAALLASAFVEYAGFRQWLAVHRASSFVSVFRRRHQWGKPRRLTIAHSERTGPREPPR